MSYIYLQEQAGESSAECFSDIPAYVLSRLNLTAEKPCSNASETESFQSSLYGMMSAPSTEGRGVGLSMSYVEEVHAKALVRREQTILPLEGLELMAEALSFFTNTSELLAKFNRTFVSGKILQQLPLKGLKRCSPVLTRWGITREGECLSAEATVRTTKESGCSLLPTPTSHNSKEGNYPAEHRRNTKTLAAQIGGKINPEWNEWRMGWPIGWTDLRPLGTDKFQQWLHSHGEHYANKQF